MATIYITAAILIMKLSERVTENSKLRKLCVENKELTVTKYEKKAILGQPREQ